MNKDKARIERTTYGILDLLGDTGGFLEAEGWFALFAIFLFQF